MFSFIWNYTRFSGFNIIQYTFMFSFIFCPCNFISLSWILFDFWCRLGLVLQHNEHTLFQNLINVYEPARCLLVISLFITHFLSHFVFIWCHDMHLRCTYTSFTFFPSFFLKSSNLFFLLLISFYFVWCFFINIFTGFTHIALLTLLRLM